MNYRYLFFRILSAQQGRSNCSLFRGWAAPTLNKPFPRSTGLKD